MNNSYDTLILGSGPIAASTAYFLSQDSTVSMAMVTQDPTESHEATYLYAGGSIRWFWPDDIKIEMTKTTADFIQTLDEQGVDLSLVRDNYLFLNQGKYVPSINISSKKLIDWLISEACARGLDLHQNETILSVEKEGELWKVKTTKSEYTAHKVVAALGAKNKNLIPDTSIEIEQRKLFVLAKELTNDEIHFPHTVIPINDGVAYIFVKKMPNGMRFVVGQEDVIEDSSDPEDTKQFAELLQAGLAAALPFLKEVKVEKVLWGNDVKNKNLALENRDNFFIANCGSAVRSCVWIGQEIVKAIKKG